MYEKRSWWQKIKGPLAVVGIIIACMLGIALIIGIVGGYLFNWGWTGIKTKTLWDWLNLLGVLAIPVVVGFGAVWFSTRQGKVADAENKDNQRETALQTYLDRMSELLLEKNLRNSQPDDEVRSVARSQTLTVIRSLDGNRKRSLLQFLHESGLIANDESKGIISLERASLQGINLHNADLPGANLTRTSLRNADMRNANLQKTSLRGAKMTNANLSNANLYEADLSNALLAGVILHHTNLSKANLWGADLSNADLRGAIVSPEQLNETESLKGATMPDGSIHQ